MMGSGMVLSHCDALEVQSVTDTLGREWAILGFAVQTEPGAPDPVGALRESTSHAEEVVRTWTGRWALIGSDVLHPDPTAMLGCFYRIIEDGPRAGVWISSSVALLAGLVGSPSPGPLREPLDWGSGVDWFPPPTSRYKGIRRVLPSQALEFAEGMVTPRRRKVPEPVRPSRSSEEIAAAVERRLVTALRNIARSSNGTPWLALTAGKDSRLLLAAARAAGVEVRTFTQELPFYRWNLSDRTLPPLLSEKVGYEHRFIRAESLERDLLRLWDEHTAGQSVETDRVFIARRQWDPIPPGSTVLRAGVFETAQCAEHSILPPVARDSGEMLDCLARWAVFSGRPLTSDQAGALSEWLNWINEDVGSGLDWRDRFYMEQRVGGWLSSVEQGLDCTGRRSLHPANCSALLEDLLAFDPSMRVTFDHHEMLIERMAPELLEYPINPPDNWSRRLAGRVMREGYRLTHARHAGGYFRDLGYRIRHR